MPASCLRWHRALVLGTSLACALPLRARAQTDYYNTDAGRPIRVEDAYAIERRAFELQMAPLRLERPRAGGYRWGVEPELALGVLPRTHIGIGLPLVHAEGVGGGNGRVTALGGVDLKLLYNLNAETAWPALAVAASLVLPVGGMAPAAAIPSVKAIATRTLSWARFHANAEVTLARARGVLGAPAHAEFTRWMAGVAMDRPVPLRSMLLTAEVVASAGFDARAPHQWDAAGGVRYQLSPRIALDGGGGYRLRGNDPGWFVTTGAAVAVGLPLRGGR